MSLWIWRRAVTVAASFRTRRSKVISSPSSRRAHRAYGDERAAGACHRAQVRGIPSPKSGSLTRMAFARPVVLMICYDSRESYKAVKHDGYECGDMDASIVTTTMMMEATDLGPRRSGRAGFSAADLEKAFGLPENMKLVCSLDVGYADGKLKFLAAALLYANRWTRSRKKHKRAAPPFQGPDRTPGLFCMAPAGIGEIGKKIRDRSSRLFNGNGANLFIVKSNKRYRL